MYPLCVPILKSKDESFAILRTNNRTFVRIKNFAMDSKLTLKLNQEVIEKAKAYASNKKLSLSRLIENYLNSLTSDQSSDEVGISPFVKSLSSGVKIRADYDYKKDRADYLDKKHK